MAGNGTVHTGLHISASQIRTYLKCGRLYELRYVRGVTPAFKPTAFAFGSAFHAALAQFYVAVKEDGRAPSLECVTYAFRDAWERELEGDIPLQADDEEPGDKGQLVDKGVAMLTLFHEQASKTMAGVEVEAVEKPFSVDIYDPDDRGGAGREAHRGVRPGGERRPSPHGRREARPAPGSTARTRSAGTSSRPPTSSPRRRWGSGTSKVRYEIVTKTKTPAIQVVDLDRTEEDEQEFLRVALGMMRGVDAGVFIPQRGWAVRRVPVRLRMQAAGAESSSPRVGSVGGERGPEHGRLPVSPQAEPAPQGSPENSSRGGGPGVDS